MFIQQTYLITFYNLVIRLALQKLDTLFVILIWCACTWVIWKEMNNRIFNNKASSVVKLVDNVMQLSFLCG